MDEIKRRHIEKESIKYTVNCAHRALLQLLEMEFYVHDKGQPFYSGHPVWMPDEEPKPSPADSWAVAQVPISQKSLPALQEFAEEYDEKVSYDDASVSEAGSYEESQEEDLNMRNVYDTKQSGESMEELEEFDDLESLDEEEVCQGAGDSEVRLAFSTSC